MGKEIHEQSLKMNPHAGIKFIMAEQMPEQRTGSTKKGTSTIQIHFRVKKKIERYPSTLYILESKCSSYLFFSRLLLEILS